MVAVAVAVVKAVADAVGGANVGHGAAGCAFAAASGRHHEAMQRGKTGLRGLQGRHGAGTTTKSGQYRRRRRVSSSSQIDLHIALLTCTWLNC